MWLGAFMTLCAQLHMHDQLRSYSLSERGRPAVCSTILPKTSAFRARLRVVRSQTLRRCVVASTAMPYCQAAKVVHITVLAPRDDVSLGTCGNIRKDVTEGLILANWLNQAAQGPQIHQTGGRGTIT